jgi:hypothetical protein
MEIGREDLDAAVRSGVLSAEQADALWRRLAARERAPPPPRESALARDVIVVAVGLVCVPPAAWLLLDVWQRWGGAGGFAVSVALGCAFLAAARLVGRRSGSGATSVLVLAGVALVPVAVHAAQHWAGADLATAPPADLGDWLHDPDVPVLAATAIAGGVALRAFALPPLTLVLPVVAWFAAMSVAPAIFGADVSWSQRALLSALVGLLVLAAGFAVDRRTRRDHAFWLYLAGLVAFWGGLATYHAETGLSLALFVFLDVCLVLVAVVVRRRLFAVFGAVGLGGAAGHLAVDLLVPAAVAAALAAVAIGLTVASLAYDRVEGRLRRAVVGHLPAALRRVLPPGVPGDAAP